jgi:hypothetical protein
MERQLSGDLIRNADIWRRGADDPVKDRPSLPLEIRHEPAESPSDGL